MEGIHHALHRRHEGEAALRLLAKQTQIGRRIADPEHALPARVRPARADAAPDEAARHGAEPLGIKVAQVDDVVGHRLDLITNTRHVASAGAKADDPGTSCSNRLGRALFTLGA